MRVVGPPELVDLAVQRHRLPGHGPRLAFNALHDPLQSFLAKKHKLAVDAWGSDDSAVHQFYDPLVQHIKDEIPEKYQNLYPHPVWKLESRVTRLARNILVAEFMVQEWADHFVGKSLEELDALAASFKYASCAKREDLNAILRENAKLVAQA